MHIILAGTGLVGTVALDALMKDTAVTKITVLSRHAVPQADGCAKAKVVIQQDFSTYSEELLAELKGAKGCIWTVGPPYLAVTRPEYEKAHIDLPAEAAKIFASLNDKFNFVYISHDDCHNHPSIWFLDVKSRAEERLSKLHNDPSKRLNFTRKPELVPQEEDAIPSISMYFVRPALIDYSKHEEVKPYLKPLTFAKKWSNYIGLPVYRFFGLTTFIGDSREMGRVMVG